MAESSLYRQRLEVIAKLRVERLKRKSLRERWLMDGAAEEPEQQEDSTSKDPQSPEGQAQARIRNLEDSLFTLEVETLAGLTLSLLPLQGHRPLSQPTVEAGPTGHTDLSRRASLPAGPVDTSPESPSEPRDEAVRVPPTLRLFPGAAGASSEANGPCPGPSPAAEQGPSQGLAASEGGVGEAKGRGVVEVVWEGLRATEDCATEATGPELEAKVEEMVLEAIGDRQEAACPEPPSWVKEDRGMEEVVWEGGPSRVEQKEGEDKLEASEEPLVTEGKEGEKSLEAEKGGGEAPSEAERTGGEAPLVAERTGGEALSGAEKGGEAPSEAERGGEAPSEAERGGEASLKAEETDVVEEDLSPEEQRESGGGKECQAEEVSEAGASLGAKEESRPEEEGPQPQEKQEGSLEEESVRPQTPAEGQGPSGDATTPLLAETPAPEQPAECQPLLRVEGPRANPSARPVPTYAPARQPEPPAPPEGEEASGPKQKTCQCCVVM
uniref:Paralemmin-3 n=1 Tax=Panthera tigris altaica TaxID=74533 RepID=A0A8C9MD11_PANTA